MGVYMSVSQISSINNISTQNLNSSSISENSESKVSFKDIFYNALNKVNDLILYSDQLTEDFAAGKTDNIHDVMIALEKADIALQFTMQIRNKLVDAYEEIMRMQI